MAQAAAASGNSASESSWETASGVSSPAHSTGGSASGDTTRGEAAAVTAKRKADAEAAEVWACCRPGKACRP